MTPSSELRNYRLSASAHADECAPQRGEDGADENVGRVIAKYSAVAAHICAKRTKLVISGRIKQPRQSREHDSSEIHRRPPCHATGCWLRHPTPSSSIPTS